MAVMLVNFVIPVRNYHKVTTLLNELRRQIAHINKDTVKIGVTVVNDASTDGTGQVLDDYRLTHSTETNDWLKVIHLEQRKNIGGARNAGVRGGYQSQYVSFLDADDMITKDAIRKIVNGCEEALATDKDCVMWGLKTIKKDSESVFIPKIGEEDTFMYNPNAAWIKAIYWSVFTPFPEDVFCEDCAWWFKQADRISSILFIPEVLYLYDRTGNGFSSSIDIEPQGLSKLAKTDYLKKHGLTDRMPSDCLRNLAALYDLRNEINNPEVKRALLSRLDTMWNNIRQGVWSF